MTFAQFQRKDGVTKVVPIDNQARVSEETDEGCDCESGN